MGTGPHPDPLSEAVMIDYTNHRGERSVRGVVPISIRFGTSEWHRNEEQWLMRAHDLTRNAEREFAMKDIHSWGSSLHQRGKCDV